ncbi:hypothetical protein QQ045_029752 [Rhodiola kirilowii]
MSKGYDRVEWRYLKLLLLRFGFDAKWVDTVLNYVSSVRYALRINGETTETFRPERGLRQGDPLSPYLFILCSEWLSRSLSKLQCDGSISSLKIHRRAPLITHLMFADDCLLLFKAEERTGEIFSSLLKTYENISVQVINYHKSELVLSSNATDAMKRRFHDHLAVNVVNCHDRYLGLPLTLRRKLTLNFAEVLDKYRNKTQGWQEKNLSAGGKEILIKAVLQVLPQYAMNCFLFPEYVINKMHSSIWKFWWSSSTSKKPIYWTSFHVLNRNKEIGGLGFKDLKSINLAFLAKQAWRIYTNPELLKSKIFRAKYFHNIDMMQCSISLYKCGLNNFGCEVCGCAMESYSHTFLAIWSQLGISELSSLPASVSFADIIHYSWSHFTQKQMHLVLVTLWLIWYNRNKWKQDSGGGIGVVVKNSEGCVVGVRAIKGMQVSSSSVCEGAALLESLRMSDIIKAHKIIFETDCAEVVKLLNICPDPTIANEKWFLACSHLLNQHKEWKLFLIRREANFVADQLEKLVTEQDWS